MIIYNSIHIIDISCTLAFMMEKSFGILAIKDDKILVIRQVSGDHWTFCKGHKSRFKSESNRETAIRELKEETNLDIMYFINDQTYVQEYPITRKGKTSHQICVLLLGKSIR